jgi:hypothetical protein
VRLLPAREDPHRLGPAVQLIPAWALARQRGQLGDVALAVYAAIALGAAAIRVTHRDA